MFDVANRADLLPGCSWGLGCQAIFQIGMLSLSGALQPFVTFFSYFNRIFHCSQDFPAAF